MHAGRARQGFVQPDVPAVEHAGAVDDRAAAVRPEVGQLRGEDLEDLGAVDGDVEGVLGARSDRQQRLVDRDDSQLLGRHRAQDGVHGVALDAHACLTCPGWGAQHPVALARYPFALHVVNETDPKQNY
ncbi:hypothetical protein TNCT1_20580 [Streptomyces sp. 1-11]|nr:hypothetical protein TNCT1_20580 [Streptomyces sp. 1-11]